MTFRMTVGIAAIALAGAAFAQTLDDLKRDRNGSISNPAIRAHVSPGASVWTFALMEE